MISRSQVNTSIAIRLVCATGTFENIDIFAKFATTEAEILRVFGLSANLGVFASFLRFLQTFLAEKWPFFGQNRALTGSYLFNARCQQTQVL